MLSLFRVSLINIVLLWCFEVNGAGWCPNSCTNPYPTNEEGKCKNNDIACPWPNGDCGVANTPYNPQDNGDCPWYCCPPV